MWLRSWRRRHARHPASLLATVAALAIGTASVAAVQVIVRRTLVEPLPAVRAAGLVALRHGPDRTNAADYRIGDLAKIRNSGAFDSVAAFCRLSPQQPLTINGVTRPVETLMVSGDYFNVLGVRMAAGRRLNDTNDATAAHVAVVSDRVARDAFGEAVAALGRQSEWARSTPAS